MSLDPYSSPSLNSPPKHSAPGVVTAGVIQQLAKTKPWVRFMSVLLFIAAGGMLLGSLIVLVAAGAIAAASKEAGIGAGLISLFAILYALISLLYVYPALKLWKYADRIAILMVSGDMLDLETALNHQRAFWKFLGITVITVFALYIVGVVVAVIFSIVMAATGKGVPTQGTAGVPQHLALPYRI